MKRKIGIWILAFLIVFGAAFSVDFDFREAKAESLNAKKIVSVAYDDSGSMFCGSSTTTYNLKNWAYASYAMQVMCGLLDSDDELYLTYMSSSWTGSSVAKTLDVSDSRLQSTVNSVRDHIEAQGTDLECVRTAYNKLKSIREDDETTEYWLVFLTDGDSNDLNRTELETLFNGYSKEEMDNGSYVNIAYLAVGSGAVIPYSLNLSAKPSNFYIYQATNANAATQAVQLREQLVNIAVKVSGKTILEDGEITVSADKKSVSFTASLELTGIQTLVQQSVAASTSVNASVVTAFTSSAGQTVNFARQATMRCLTESEMYALDPGNNHRTRYGSKYRATDINIRGATCQITGANGSVLEKGTYTIQFDKPIDLYKANTGYGLIVMVDPAIEIGAKVTDAAGNDLTLLGSVEGQTAYIDYWFYEIFKEDVHITDATYGIYNVTYHATVYTVDNKTNVRTLVKNTTETHITLSSLQAAQYEITVEVTVGKFETMRKVLYMPVEGCDYTIAAYAADDTSRELASNAEISIFPSEFETNAEAVASGNYSESNAVAFLVKRNGSVMSAASIRALLADGSLNFIVTPMIGYETFVTADGYLWLIPTAQNNATSISVTLVAKVGNVQKATKTVRFAVEDAAKYSVTVEPELLKMTIDELYANNTAAEPKSILFTVTKSGVPLDGETVQDLFNRKVLLFSAEHLSEKHMDYDFSVDQATGKLKLVPRYPAEGFGILDSATLRVTLTCFHSDYVASVLIGADSVYAVSFISNGEDKLGGLKELSEHGFVFRITRNGKNIEKNELAPVISGGYLVILCNSHYFEAFLATDSFGDVVIENGCVTVRLDFKEDLDYATVDRMELTVSLAGSTAQSVVEVFDIGLVTDAEILSEDGTPRGVKLADYRFDRRTLQNNGLAIGVYFTVEGYDGYFAPSVLQRLLGEYTVSVDRYGMNIRTQEIGTMEYYRDGRGVLILTPELDVWQAFQKSELTFLTSVYYHTPSEFAANILIDCNGEGQRTIRLSALFAPLSIWIIIRDICLFTLMILGGIAAIAYIVGMIIKPRFKRGTCIYSTGAHVSGNNVIADTTEWKEVPLARWNISSFIPFIPCFKKINGVTFYAYGNSTIYISPDELAKKHMTQSRIVKGLKEHTISRIPISQLPKPFVNKKGRNVKMKTISPNGGVMTASAEMGGISYFKYKGKPKN